MDGILVVDKPQGMTSHDVVDFIRKRFGLKKVGHAGTLDPMATGVLVVLIGSFTKSSNSFLNDDKEYEAAFTLGARSDTGDAWGRITVIEKDINFEREDIEIVFKKFLGHIEQIPPMYSAVKVGGEKLYNLARKGIDIKRDPRKVFIKKLEIFEVALPEVRFKVTCSKGTYVRQLCADIGEDLGCGAYMSYLRRTRSGNFEINEAVGLDELKRIGREKLKHRLLNKCES